MAQRAVDTRDTPPCVLELIRRFFLYKKNPVHQEHQAPNDRGVFLHKDGEHKFLRTNTPNFTRCESFSSKLFLKCRTSER